MKPYLCRFVLAGLICCLGVGCTTAYDANGYPQQVVDPAAAVLGAAAVGLLVYGLSGNNDHDYHQSSHRGHHSYNHGGYYRDSHYPSYGSHYDCYD